MLFPKLLILYSERGKIYIFACTADRVTPSPIALTVLIKNLFEPAGEKRREIVKYISFAFARVRVCVSYEARSLPRARPHYRDEFTTPFGDPHFADRNEPVSTEYVRYTV